MASPRFPPSTLPLTLVLRCATQRRLVPLLSVRLCGAAWPGTLVSPVPMDNRMALSAQIAYVTVLIGRAMAC